MPDATDHGEADLITVLIENIEPGGRSRMQLDAKKDRVHSILASHLGLPASALEIGKADNRWVVIDRPDLWISTSYSESKMAVAFSNVEIGVDIEHVDAVTKVEDVVETLFHRNEQKAMQTAAIDQRDALFARIWTQKEAYSKALGKGFEIEFSGFAVLPQGGAVLAGPERTDLRDWHTAVFELDDGHVLGIAGPNAPLSASICST